jgi:TolB-like protein
MTEPPAPAAGEPNAPPSAGGVHTQAPVPQGIWERLKHHKVAQWTLAYAAAAYTLLHCGEMVSEAMDWPHLVARILTLVLALGVPVVITLAWYHGAKGLKRISGPELLIVALLLFLVGSVLWYQTRSGSSRAVSASTAASPSSTAPIAPRTSIAVMPFANLTGDASKDYLGDGMSEELIDVLTNVPGLTVPSRTSSFAYKGRNTDLRQIARDLQVGTVLEGSVRSAGDRIRITAQLIDAQSDRHLWSGTYNRKFADLFKLQDDLAQAIVQALQLKLSGAAAASVTQAPPTQDLAAYNLYLQGRSVQNRPTEQDLHLALDLFGQALARDPKFARALAARAVVRTLFLSNSYPLENALEDAERDARQALALDPNLSWAHAALGTTSAYRADWLRAEASFEAALAVDGRNPDIHEGYAFEVLAATGRLHQALAEASEAYHLAPASELNADVMATLSSLMGLDADAVKYAALAVALGFPPNVAPLPQIYANAARRGARYTEAADRLVPTLSDAILGAGGAEVTRGLYAALGDPAKKPAARQALQSLVDKLEVGNQMSANWRDLIFDFVMLDALDPAYDLANRYVDEFERSGIGGGATLSFLWLPEMRPFRKDPRFQRLTTRLNYIDYWKQYGPPDDCELKDSKLVCR